MSKVSLSTFLRQNPFPRPWTLGFFYREKMRAIHRVAPDRPFRKILEVGGGQSGLTARLYPEAQVTNLDSNPVYAQAPCNQWEHVRFVSGDATDLPFERHTFDMVNMFDVLEHIPDHEKAAAEARRVLRPGGYLLVSAPNEHWRFPYYAFMRPICPSEEEMFEAWGHVRRGYALHELERLLQLPRRGQATFITPLTALNHDLAWSCLPRPLRIALCAAVSPLTWMGYAAHAPTGVGTETASAWQKQ